MADEPLTAQATRIALWPIATQLPLGFVALGCSHAVEHAAGIVGLVLVAMVAYAALALELENLRRRTVLPLLRRGHGEEAMSADLAHQTRGLEHEAGVREQL
jgi:uncharacterized protein